MTDQDTIAAYLSRKGLSDPQVAGVLGNLQVESSFDPTAYNPKEQAIGIAQWEGSRRRNLQAYAAAAGTTETDLGTQLDFMWAELTGPESASLTALRRTSTPADAATVFNTKYERSAKASLPKRVKAAKAIAASLGPGVSTTTGLTPAGPLAGTQTTIQTAGYVAPAGLVSGAAGAVTSAVAPLVYTGIGLVLAGGLVVAGLWRTFSPAVSSGARKVSGAAGKVGKLAAL